MFVKLFKDAEPFRGKTIGRGSFSRTDKEKIGEQHIKLFREKEVEEIPVPAGKIRANGTFKPGSELARRHVVSSQDMIDHYQASLQDKTPSVARILISERSSIADARTSIDEPGGVVEVRKAAKTRYNKFFSYTNNLFIGNALTNSSLGRLLDPHHPSLVKKSALDDHVARIKREWSFGTGFAISVGTKQDTVI